MAKEFLPPQPIKKEPKWFQIVVILVTSLLIGGLTALAVIKLPSYFKARKVDKIKEIVQIMDQRYLPAFRKLAEDNKKLEEKIKELSK
jgi:hypothetical protein|tara:strand:- start:83 stop:346 length:264 start_codon:yes stop_codon:yes gene_type:complete